MRASGAAARVGRDIATIGRHFDRMWQRGARRAGGDGWHARRITDGMRWWFSLCGLVLCVGCHRGAAERPAEGGGYTRFEQPFDEAVAEDVGAAGSDLDALFHRWDVDRSGGLSRDELADPVFEAFARDGAIDQANYDAIAMRWLGRNAPPLDDWDDDGDGFLDRDEWRVAMGGRHAEWDLDADGFVEAGELRRGIHRGWDLDGDHVLTDDEMVFPAVH